MIEQRHLRQILAIVEHGSFRKAADALNMSQPALSKSIRILEERLATPLLDRRTRPVQPTAYGRLFVQRARLATGIVKDLEAQIRQLARLKQGMVRIGLTRIAGESLIRNVMVEFAVRYPEIRMQVEMAGVEETRGRFEALRLDLIIADQDYPQGPDGTLWIPLGEEPSVFVVRRGHPVLKEPAPSLQTLLHYPTIMPRLPNWSLDWATAIVPEKGQVPTTRPLPWISCQSYAVIHGVLLATDYVSAGLADSFQPYLESGELVTLDAPLRPPVWQPLLGYHGRHSLSPATQAFLVCLLESRGVAPPPQFLDASPA